MRYRTNHAAALEPSPHPGKSATVAVEHKNAALRAFQNLAGLFLRHLPKLGTQDAFRLAGLTALSISAAWPHGRPPEALLAAYAADPALTPMRAGRDGAPRITMQRT
ncbi:MAG: hypothetical protein ACRDQB_10855 [Thermocrispum sp.]